jgi:hypothetical protein
MSPTELTKVRDALAGALSIDEVVTALRRSVGLLGALRRGLAYLLANARRAHPARDRLTGRLRAGLTLAEPA